MKIWKLYFHGYDDLRFNLFYHLNASQEMSLYYKADPLITWLKKTGISLPRLLKIL